MSETTGKRGALARELAYFSGMARLLERRCGGAGVILKFARVRTASKTGFRPRGFLEITPALLDRLIGKLRRWNFEVVSIDEACNRASRIRSGRRFVCLTFDGGYQDVLSNAYPVLVRHDVPFAVYLPTAFPDRLGQAWWLALEVVIATHDRISLMMDGSDRHFNVAGLPEKHQLYDFLDRWLRTLAPADLAHAIHDLCARYSVDLAAPSRYHFMTWDGVRTLTDDPRVTLGTATVNYPVLANLDARTARREVTMGRAVAQAALGRDPLHLAFPFGEQATFDPNHVAIARNAGFRSALGSVPGVVFADGRSDLYALPRITWRGQSLRALRVMMSGVLLPRE